jgi:AAA family ATP:ADP antiporter
MSHRAESRSPLERLLNLFTEVRAGEARTVLIMALNIFLILLAYYIIKPVREAFILAVPRGAELKSYVSAGQAILLLLVAVPLYARLAGVMARRKLLNTVNLFFIANLVLFYVAVISVGPGTTVLAVAFFLWVGIFNLMVPAQFWSLANDVYTPGEGKRLFVIVMLGASTGGALGGIVTGWLIEPLGLNQLLLVSAGVLVLSTVLTNVVEAREHRRAGEKSREQAKEEEAPLSKDGAFKLVLQTRYLLLIAFLMLFLNWVNTNGEFILGNAVGDHYKSEVVEALGPHADEAAVDEWVESRIGKFYANFFTVVNIGGLLIQLLLVSRILKYLGVRVALMILPLISLGGYALLVFAPVLGAIRWAKTAENSTDYSLQNTVRQALFLPTTREQKYKAKQAIDTFFWRAGDVLSAALVYVGLNWLSLENNGFAMFNIFLVLVWLALAFAIGKEYKRRTAE